MPVSDASRYMMTLPLKATFVTSGGTHSFTVGFDSGTPPRFTMRMLK
jgi:hypothetical protein